MLRILSLFLLITLLSCQKDQDVRPDTTVDETTTLEQLRLTATQSNVHPSVLNSDWWQEVNPVVQSFVSIEIGDPNQPVTWSELEVRLLQSTAIAELEKVSGSSPGYPTANPGGDVTLETQADVDAFGAQNYKSIAGALAVVDNGSADPICDLSPLSKLKSIGSSMTINSPCITTLDGLNKLKSIGKLGPFGFVGILGENLTDIEALNKVRTVTGSINIINCDQLSSITSAFSRVTTIKSGKTSAPLTSVYVLNINDNAQLTDISAFGSITEIEGGLRILSNGALADLNDLSGLSTIGDDIFIIENTALLDVDALSVITALNDDLFVFDNPSLGTCCGLYNLLCGNPPMCTISGVADVVAIFNNDAGCTDLDIIAGGACP